MPTDAFEDSVDLEIDLLEVVAPASPYPSLKTTGQKELRSFQTVILENAYLRVTILPGVGGRILSIFDKRTSTEIMHPPTLLGTAGGRRGVSMHYAGMSLQVDGTDRLNDFGPVDFQVEEPPEAVWIAETSGGTGLSFHLRIELPNERAELVLEARVMNRTLRPVPYNGGLAFHLGWVAVDEEVAWSPHRKAGLRVHSEELEHGQFLNGRVVRSRFSEMATLGPRQVDVWKAVLTPFSGVEGLPLVANDVVAFVDETQIQVQATEPIAGARILLGLADGQTVEAPVDLYPEHVLTIPLDDLPAAPVAIAIQDADRQDRFRGEVKKMQAPPEPFLPGAAAPAGVGDPEVASLDEKGLRRLTFSPTHRAVAFLELGHRALAAGEFREADELLENALLYNADDPLTWWAKAMARRLAGIEEESPELPNAHYLAPMEPALRAEAFLAQSPNQGREPNPLVGPLKDKPEALIEVAVLLLEIGVRGEASRWMDEALRQRPVAMLHYLAAWSLLEGSRMRTEASLHLSAAGRLPFEPPYPWREIEQRALRDLVVAFPDDERLRSYAELVK
jgi:hypothetical protein